MTFLRNHRVTTGQVKRASVKEVMKDRKRLSDYPLLGSMQVFGMTEMTNYFHPSVSYSFDDRGGFPLLPNRIPTAISVQERPIIVNMCDSTHLTNFVVPAGRPASICRELIFSNNYYPVPPMSESLLAHAAELASAQTNVRSSFSNAYSFCY